MVWVLTIILASGLMIPVADFSSQDDCLHALDMWTLEPGVRINCFATPADEVGTKRPRERHRRHRRGDD